MTPFDAPFATPPELAPAGLSDGLGRKVTYLRVSVTDRCDLRCVYCMAEHMRFLPKAEVLTLEELERVASVFIGLGVRKLRLTGGEPLVRKGLIGLGGDGCRVYLRTGALRRADADHQRRRGWPSLRPAISRALACERINVSLDTLDPATCPQKLTRGGDLSQRPWLALDAAKAAGLRGQDQHRGARSSDNAGGNPRARDPVGACAAASTSP